MGDDLVLSFIEEKMAYLKTSRPTAVNLSNALDEVKASMAEALTKDNDRSSRARLLQAVLNYAEFMLERDVSDNRAIGDFGASAIIDKVSGGPNTKVNVVTICNTGSLATAGYGTALGIVRSLHKRNQLESVTALETRPYNQGSRLTSFEIVEENMPGGQLICDSAAGALMQVCLFVDNIPKICLPIVPNLLLPRLDRQRRLMPLLLEPIAFALMETPRIKLGRTISP